MSTPLVACGPPRRTARPCHGAASASVIALTPGMRWPLMVQVPRPPAAGEGRGAAAQASAFIAQRDAEAHGVEFPKSPDNVHPIKKQ